MNEIVEPVNLGISEENHKWLKRFKEEHIFSEMRDAYKFAVAYAIAKDLNIKDITSKETVFGIATIDPTKELYFAISSLRPMENEAKYHILEMLADAGMTELVKEYQQNKLNLAQIIADIDRE